MPCNLEVWAPWYRNSHIENIAFTQFAMECEGDLPTRSGRINKLIKLLAQCADPNDKQEQYQASAAAGIEMWELTNEEREYVILEVERRRSY